MPAFDMHLPNTVALAMQHRPAPMLAYLAACDPAYRVRATDAATWIRIILCLDTAALFNLAVDTHDALPWAPFLRLVQAQRRREDQAAWARAETHLRAVAREMLDLQGLELLEPDDVLAQPPMPERSVARAMEALSA